MKSIIIGRGQQQAKSLVPWVNSNSKFLFAFVLYLPAQRQELGRHRFEEVRSPQFNEVCKPFLSYLLHHQFAMRVLFLFVS